MNKDINEQRPERVSYSYGNLPLSVKQATDRLDVVDKNIATIEADLRAKTERDLGTEDAYDRWKISASRAVAHQRREKAFLLQWLSYETGRLERNQEIISLKERRDRLHAMVTEFLDSALPYGTPLSSDASKNPENVIARRAELSELKMEYGAFLTFLRGESFRIHCPPDYYHSARSRVARTVQKAEAEFIVLKKITTSRGSLGSRTYNPNARPSKDARMIAIVNELHEVKTKIGMDGSLMTAWLYELIIPQKHLLALTSEQIVKLELIGEYVRLSNQRRLIQFGS